MLEKFLNLDSQPNQTTNLAATTSIAVKRENNFAKLSNSLSLNENTLRGPQLEALLALRDYYSQQSPSDGTNHTLLQVCLSAVISCEFVVDLFFQREEQILQQFHKQYNQLILETYKLNSLSIPTLERNLKETLGKLLKCVREQQQTMGSEPALVTIPTGCGKTGIICLAPFVANMKSTCR